MLCAVIVILYKIWYFRDINSTWLQILFATIWITLWINPVPRVTIISVIRLSVNSTCSLLKLLSFNSDESYLSFNPLKPI